MDRISPTNDENIIHVLFDIIPIIEICEKIVYLKNCSEKKEALDKYGAEGSGKNLPFSSLSDDLKKKDKKKE